MKRILVVDDEKNMCTILEMLLKRDGYAVITANSGEEALAHVRKDEIIDLIISDLKLPDIDGLEILNFLKTHERQIPLVLITAYGSIELAVEAMKKGAEDFITKPFNKEVIRHIVRRIFRIENLEEENTLLKATDEESFSHRSPVMRNLMDTIQKVALVPSAVLILGESGTGKGFIAKAIHKMAESATHTSSAPFVRINCPAIPETLLQSELFGYRKGAFTGASSDFKGKIRMADGGTLFLDEIGDLPHTIQPKLLRLLEEKAFEPLGSNATIHVNTKIICATNRDLKALVAEGSFRKDLFYRINTFTIHVPPLRERKEDIIPLSEFLLHNLLKEIGIRKKTLTENVKDAFQTYSWPGNVRELINVIERACVLSNGDTITLADIPTEFQHAASEPALDDAESFNNDNKLVNVEKLLLIDALKKCQWNISAAARELGISRNTLRYRIAKYKLKSE